MATQEHVDLLKQGVEQWNEWRKEHPNVDPDLSNIDLFGMDLSGANLSMVNFSGTDFWGDKYFDPAWSNFMPLQTNFKGANLREANLSKADLRNAILIEADLSKADLSGADLTSADLSNAIFSGANLTEATIGRVSNPWAREVDLSGANFSGANLSEAKLWELDLKAVNLSGVNFSGVNFSRLDLSRVNLSEVNLSNANLKGVNLSNANLSKANLTKANLSQASLEAAILCETFAYDADFGEAKLLHANLSNANLYGIHLTKADLRWAILIGADLRGANLDEVEANGANLTGADLSGANLSGAHLHGALFSEATLTGANLQKADLSAASLVQAHLREAILMETDLSEADLSNADLTSAYLIRAYCIETNLTGATLTQCFIYGISVWNVQLEGAKQDNLIITPDHEPAITVDDLEVAQFIYLLLNNPKIRDVIDTIAKKAVLILGRFPDERKKVLEALRDELRNQNYSPVVFNFEEADSRDFTTTVRTLANMTRFVLLDLTDLNETIREIADTIVPRCVVPIRPLLHIGSRRQEYELFRELPRKHRWVLAPYRYKDLPDLRSGFQEKVLQPINEKIIELKQKKPLKIFIGYAQEDKNMLNTLKTYLRPLERAGVIELWDDQDVALGEEKRKEVERQLYDACIILLLISPAFLISPDCYEIQMSVAIERHEQGEARVIPIILRPCAWQSTPLKELQPLPRDGKPISKHNKDDVFFEVSEEVGDVIKILG